MRYIKTKNIFFVIFIFLNFLFLSNYSYAFVPIEDSIRQFDTGQKLVCVVTIKNDLYCWGYNKCGEVGNGSTTNQKTPFKVLENVKHVSIVKDQMDGSETHVCAIRTNGDLYCWGSNKNGEMGQGSKGGNQLTPIKVKNLEDVKDVKVGNYHVCAIKTNGDLYCWGRNGRGQLGDSTFTDRYTPIKVMENIASVAIQDTTCAINTIGELYCFGNNASGQVGDGTTSHRNTPYKVLEDVASVNVVTYGLSMGGVTCALKTNGDVYCFGNNENGEIGNGNTENQLTPIKVFEGAISINVSFHYTCAIKHNNEAYCWGENTQGKLGNGTTENALEPTKVLLEDIEYITLGMQQSDTHTCAITIRGELYCFGANYYKQLGCLNEGDTSIPRKAMDNIASVKVGTSFTCANTYEGKLFCFGYNNVGQVGDDITDFDNIKYPKKVMDDVKDIKMRGIQYFGNSAICVLNKNGDLYCWGRNTDGAVGNDTTEFVVEPEKILSNIRQIDVAYHVCAINNYNELYCWGRNDYGGVGNGSTQNQLTPVKVLDNVEKVKLMWENQTCAITTNKNLYCWGRNTDRRIGVCSSTKVTTPTYILNDVEDVDLGGGYIIALKTNGELYHFKSDCTFEKLLDDVASIKAGYITRYAIKSNGDLYAWGSNDGYQVGNGSTEYQSTPVKILEGVKSVESKWGYHSCAVKTNGELYCWGENTSGEVGTGDKNEVPQPVKILDGVMDVKSDGSGSADSQDTCALMLNGDVYCWGKNSNGMHGNGTTSRALVPTKSYYGNVKSISVSEHVVCAINQDNELWCSGRNDGGNNGASILNYQRKIFEGGSSLDFCNDCCNACNYNELNNECLLENQSACGINGKYLCFDALSNPSIVCASPKCCEDALYSSIGTICNNGGIGACYKDGEYYCAGTKTDSEVLCDAPIGEPRDEICDESDNDCDGEVDEIFGVGEYCETSGVGLGENICDPNDNENVICNIQQTFTPTNTYTNTYTSTNTPTMTNTFTETETNTPTNTFTYTVTNTVTNTATQTFTDTPTFTETYTVTNTITQTYTDTPTLTNTYTNTFTETETNTPTNTYTNTATDTFTNTHTNTFTETSTNTYTSTVTNTHSPKYTLTNTETFTPTIYIVPTIEVVTPNTPLPEPNLDKDVRKNILLINLPKIIKGKITYLIHIRKLKRLGIKDKFYKLGKRFLTYHRKNKLRIKGIDKGIYSIRYKVIISNKKHTKSTKWSKRALVEI